MQSFAREGRSGRTESEWMGGYGRHLQESAFTPKAESYGRHGRLEVEGDIQESYGFSVDVPFNQFCDVRVCPSAEGEGC